MSNKNLIQEHKLTLILDGIESKILERGLFTKFLGTEFTISISIEEDAEDDKNVFDLHTKIISVRKQLNDTKAEEISDYVFDKFFELLEENHTKKSISLLRNAHRENIVTFNDNRVY